MEKMKSLIRELNSRIDIPQPHRSDLICEIYYDMKETYEHYMNRGSSPEDAESRTCEKFNFDETALRELSDLHCSGYCKMLNRFTTGLRSGIDKNIMRITVLFILLVYFIQISSTDLFSNAGNFIFVPRGITSAAIIFAVIKIMKLYVKKDHKLKSLKQGSGSVMFCSVLTLITGVFGYFFQFYEVTLHVVKDIKLNGFSSELLVNALVTWHLKGSALLIFSVFSSIIIAITWLVIIKKEGKIIDREADLIINDPFL